VFSTHGIPPAPPHWQVGHKAVCVLEYFVSTLKAGCLNLQLQLDDQGLGAEYKREVMVVALHTACF
jgi:hypothetical protein